MPNSRNVFEGQLLLQDINKRNKYTADLRTASFRELHQHSFPGPLLGKVFVIASSLFSFGNPKLERPLMKEK